MDGSPVRAAGRRNRSRAQEASPPGNVKAGTGNRFPKARLGFPFIWSVSMKVAGAFLLVPTLLGFPLNAAPQPLQFRQTTIRVGPGPRWVAVADVNHDGNPDILVTNADAATVSVLLGDGGGQFKEAPGSPFPAGHEPNDLAVADMNGDGHPDLVIPNHQAPTITILLGDGKGSFRSAPGSPFDVHSHPHPHDVAVADFDGDGKPDIVTTNLDDDTVSILLGDGKAGFATAPGSPFHAGSKPWQVFAGDLNGDGNADLVVIPYQRDIASESQNVVTILLGDGHGAFHPMPGSPLPLGNCRGPNGVTAGQLRPRQETLAISCAQSRNLMLYTRATGGQYQTTSVPFKGGWGNVAFANLTKDSRGQLITANDDGTITIYFPQ